MSWRRRRELTDNFHADEGMQENNNNAADAQRLSKDEETIILSSKRSCNGKHVLKADVHKVASK